MAGHRSPASDAIELARMPCRICQCRGTTFAGCPSGVGVAVADSPLAMRFPAPCADLSSVDDFFGFGRRQGVADALVLYLDDAMEG
jgi:hypothetical protein